MRKIIFVGVFFLLVGIIVVAGFFYFKPAGQDQVKEFFPDKKPLTIAKSDIDTGLSQYVISYTAEQFPDFTGKDSTGAEFKLHNYVGKRLLLYFNVERCESCKAYYPLLQDWAQRYRDSLQVIVFYPADADEQATPVMVEAGIKVVPMAEELVKELKLNHSSNNYLLDTRGMVKHYFYFNELDWKNIDGFVDVFARTGELPAGLLARDHLEKDEVFPDLQGVKAVNDESELNVGSLKGKPTVIYFSDQVCRFCNDGYSLMESLRHTFAKKINFAIVLRGQRVDEAYVLAREYYAKYGLELPGLYTEEFGPNANERYVAEHGLTVPVYCASEIIYERWGVKQVPTLLILDKEVRVKSYVPLESQESENALFAQNYVEKEVKKLLKTK